MNKNLTIIGSSFFILEAIGIIIYLLDITMSIETMVAIIFAGAINIAFFGIFSLLWTFYMKMGYCIPIWLRFKVESYHELGCNPSHLLKSLTLIL